MVNGDRTTEYPDMKIAFIAGRDSQETIKAFGGELQ